jgi:hypothetical protein
MPRFQPSWKNLVNNLTSFRAGMVEDQSDADRNELFSDPTPYFSLRTQFGINKSEYEQFSSGSKVAFRPTTGGPDMKTIARTNGIKGPSEGDLNRIDATAPRIRAAGGRRKRT